MFCYTNMALKEAYNIFKVYRLFAKEVFYYYLSYLIFLFEPYIIAVFNFNITNICKGLWQS